MMGPVGLEGAALHAAVARSISHADGALANWNAQVPDLVAKALAAPLDLLGKLVDIIDAARRVHPAGVAVESLVDEELPPGGGAVDVESFAARHLQFGPEVEAGVRIDQKERSAVGGQFRREC